MLILLLITTIPCGVRVRPNPIPTTLTLPLTPTLPLSPSSPSQQAIILIVILLQCATLHCSSTTVFVFGAICCSTDFVLFGLGKDVIHSSMSNPWP